MLTLAGELGPEANVTVMGFAPGATDTPLFRDMADKFEELHGIPLDEWAEKVLKNPGYDGFMPPEHAGASYAYCLAHASEYHGQVADAFEPLIRHSIIDLGREGEDDPTKVGAEAFTPIEDVNEFLIKMTSMNRNLERRIEERTKELVIANKRLAGQEQLVEDLASKISKYLPRQVYESIFSGKIAAEIDSRRRFLTILFCDIADFTARTERLEPEALTEVLNNYFAAKTEIARTYGATIDKFIGDAVLAFFGDPDTEGPERDAELCISMAIDMQRRVGSFSEGFVKHGLHEPLAIRIGINSGYCTVGNFGSFDRMDYTIVGQPVNVAAGLQDTGEPGQILVARNTQALDADRFQFAPVGALYLKGIADKIEGFIVTVDRLADGEPAMPTEQELCALKERLGQIEQRRCQMSQQYAFVRCYSGFAPGQLGWVGSKDSIPCRTFRRRYS